MGGIAIAIDASGSVDDVTLAQFLAEIKSVSSELAPARIDVIYCDARVHAVETYERNEQITTLHPKGGGATDFRPVFEAVAEMGEQPVAVIYLTDLDGTFPEDEPPIPTLWAATQDRAVPFGERMLIQ